MLQSLLHVTLVVPDYDDALAFFVGVLGFELLEDRELPAEGKRWVRVAPPGALETSLVLARAANDVQRAAIGRQAGGRVGFFLSTDDVHADLAHLRAHGVSIVRELREESYGTVAVFEDPWGNRWDLIEPTTDAAVVPTESGELQGAVRGEDDASYTCQSCGEEIVVPVDVTVGDHQEYVEDCPVCCRPHLLRVTLHADGGATILAQAE